MGLTSALNTALNGLTLNETTIDVLGNNIANVDVSWKYNLNQLADRFEELSVILGNEKLGFEVTEQSANRINIRLKSKPITKPATSLPSGLEG